MDHERTLTAEANETTFRQLLEEAYYVLGSLKDTNHSIINLRYRILDTLNETPLLRERLQLATSKPDAD